MLFAHPIFFRLSLYDYNRRTWHILITAAQYYDARPVSIYWSLSPLQRQEEHERGENGDEEGSLRLSTAFLLFTEEIRAIADSLGVTNLDPDVEAATYVTALARVLFFSLNIPAFIHLFSHSESI